MKYLHEYNPGNYMLMQAGFKQRCKIFAALQMLISTVTAQSQVMVIQYEQYVLNNSDSVSQNTVSPLTVQTLSP
jgi:hypothetical protein